MGTGLPALIAEGPESAASELALDSRFLFRGGDARDLAGKLDALLDDPAGIRRGVSVFAGPDALHPP